MKNYFIAYIKNPYFYLSIILMIIFPFLNILHNLETALHATFNIRSFDFYLSPYTMWIGNENGDGYGTFLYILLPILVAIPTVSVYFDYRKSGFHYFSRYKLSNQGYALLFFRASLLIGFFMSFVILMMDFLSLFLIWPDFKFHDYLALDNAGRGIYTFMFPSLFYYHPFLATCVNIFLASLYASLFTTLAALFSVYISSRFICLLLPFLIQTMVGFLSAILDLSVAWTPAQFLNMSISASRPSPLLVFFAPFLLIAIFYFLYRKKILGDG
ncbi:hypothetical protein HB912_09715 [Listeria aquatica]|uniref:ABC-2 family transporter protein n=1 Tax=Listeria aquatica TaxID=1494960 RepID=A0A841ZP46_9LIST|nr:hypothetical protein [Listeria aquatica]MBC1521923.1 hypothetical protein [Listeria aquatica]